MNKTRGPGARIRSSFWFDSSASSWWLFGGRQAPSNRGENITKLKVYTDLWRYDTSVRGWSRILPNDKLKENPGGMGLRKDLYNDGYDLKASVTSSSNSGVVLCGRSEGKRLDDRSLAVYGPRSSHSDTVWQLELKDKRQWTKYVCCCDNTGQSARNNSTRPAGTVRHENNVTRNFSIAHGNIQLSDIANNDTTLDQNLKEEISNYSNIDNTENNTKKSKDEDIQNRTLEVSTNLDNRKTNIPLNSREMYERVGSIKKESNESFLAHSPLVDNFAKENGSSFGGYNDSQSRGKPNNTNSFVLYGHKAPETDENCPSDMEHLNAVSVKNISSNTNYSDLTEDQNEETVVQNAANTATHNMQQRDIKLKKDVMTEDSHSNQAFCPNFEVSDNKNKRSRGQPVAWCDTNKELLVAIDLKVIPLTLWQFDLKTSHWAQKKVKSIHLTT